MRRLLLPVLVLAGGGVVGVALAIVYVSRGVEDD